MDTQTIYALASLLAGIALGGLLFLLYQRMQDEKIRKSADKEAEKIIHRAKSQASKIERDAQSKVKDFETRSRRNAENEIRKERQKIESVEVQLKEREERLERENKRKDEQLAERNRRLDSETERLNIADQRVKEMEQKLHMQIGDLEQKLQQISTMTPEQAKQELIRSIEDETRKEMTGRLVQIEEEIKTDFDRRAKRALATAISRYASELTTERTVTTMPLRGEEMKGKIIGREGRNIRALEAACGVDLIIDETPETVIISSFDPVRREVAKRSIEKLIEDGRVHPARIEEVVVKVKSELNNVMKEDGEKACFELGVTGVHPAVINLLGSLKYRQAEMQNLLVQSIEVATLSGLIADEIGADGKLARRAGLFHAIGRAIDHTYEGSYAHVGAEFLHKHGEREAVVHAVRCHNGEIPADTVIDHLVQSAYNVSRLRPGARRPTMEGYVRRLEDLESVANSFDGVVRTYALQTGKEIRVLVDSGKVTDGEAVMLSRDIARKIERELNYPGQVKVSVVRETRIVEHAR